MTAARIPDLKPSRFYKDVAHTNDAARKRQKQRVWMEVMRLKQEYVDALADYRNEFGEAP